MNELQNTRTLEMVAAEIRAFTASMLTNVIEIGRRMCEAKDMLPYGQFGSWIKENTGYSSSQANNFMRLFKEYGSRQGSLFGAEVEDFQTFGKLNYTKALALLALPAADRQEFVETHDVEDMSTRELQQAIKERDDAIRQRDAAKRTEKELDKALKRANERIETMVKTAETDERKHKELKARIEELESRPVEVAVQVDEEAVKKAASDAKIAADEHWKKELDKVSAQLKKAEKERDKAEEAARQAEEKALAAAGKDSREEIEKLKVDAEQARTEAEQLRRQLAMSGQAVTTFRTLFTAFQKTFSDMLDALNSADAEVASKLRAATVKQLTGWLDEVQNEQN